MAARSYDKTCVEAERRWWTEVVGLLFEAIQQHSIDYDRSGSEMVKRFFEFSERLWDYRHL